MDEYNSRKSSSLFVSSNGMININKNKDNKSKLNENKYSNKRRPYENKYMPYTKTNTLIYVKYLVHHSVRSTNANESGQIIL